MGRRKRHACVSARRDRHTHTQRSSRAKCLPLESRGMEGRPGRAERDSCRSSTGLGERPAVFCSSGPAQPTMGHGNAVSSFCPRRDGWPRVQPEGSRGHLRPWESECCPLHQTALGAQRRLCVIGLLASMATELRCSGSGRRGRSGTQTAAGRIGEMRVVWSLAFDLSSSCRSKVHLTPATPEASLLKAQQFP